MKPIVALLCFSLLSCGNPSAETPKPAVRGAVEKAVADVLTALAQRDFKTLAFFIGEEGLVVSPYVMLDKEDVRLSSTEVERCASNPKVWLWGYRDGSGDPIETTCSRFFREFVWDADYRRADEVLYDEPRQRGNDLNNNHEFAPGSIVVELHLRESPEGVEPYVPWKSLRLIFRSSDESLSLIAITRDVWTI